MSGLFCIYNIQLSLCVFEQYECQVFYHANSSACAILELRVDKNAYTSFSVLELEEVTSHNEKMKQVVQQKEDKIRTMEKK